MNCPIDNTNLQMTSRDGVEIDYCPSCRGVWLDRGELDKIIERSSQSSAAGQYSQPQKQEFRDDRRHEDYKHDDHRDRKHKKESFLGDLFDF